MYPMIIEGLGAYQGTLITKFSGFTGIESLNRTIDIWG